MEAAIYGAMPWLQHEKDEDFHPLTHGLEPGDLPTMRPVVVPRRRAVQVQRAVENRTVSDNRATPEQATDAVDEMSYCTAQLDVEGDEMSCAFFECSPIVSIPPPLGVPVISRHCSSTQNMM